MLFLRISNPDQAKRWIDQISGSIATAQRVWDFKRKLNLAKQRREKHALKSMWINIAFSHEGLSRLTPADADKFTDAAFRRSSERAKTDRIPGAKAPDPDIVLIIAADKRRDVANEVKRIKEGIEAPGPTPRGVRVIDEQSGAASGNLRGREHFGWRDGISQPGVRGWLSAERRAYFTPRTNYANPNQGLPGQDVIWPGEFIFGYERQDPNDATTPGPDSLKPYGKLVAPEWAKNGSYLVFRRLRQDVGAFHGFLFDEAKKLSVDPVALGARLIGRWPSGAPLVRTPVRDKPRLGRNNDKDNDFEYGPPADRDREGSAVPRDPKGLYCPFSAHIRKAYPRDETVAAGDRNPYEGLQPPRTLNESDTQTHRVLRRGIPYGPPSESTPRDPVDDDVDRGLLFMAYMTSISNQFEFVMDHMFNNPDFKSPRTGVDPIVGEAEGKRGHIRTVLPDEQAARELKLRRWVTTTGGGYFFAPSLSGLRYIAT